MLRVACCVLFDDAVDVDCVVLLCVYGVVVVVWCVPLVVLLM